MSNWVTYEDPVTKRAYYHNPVTMETTWDKPAELEYVMTDWSNTNQTGFQGQAVVKKASSNREESSELGSVGRRNSLRQEANKAIRGNSTEEDDPGSITRSYNPYAHTPSKSILSKQNKNDNLSSLSTPKASPSASPKLSERIVNNLRRHSKTDSENSARKPHEALSPGVYALSPVPSPYISSGPGIQHGYNKSVAFNDSVMVNIFPRNQMQPKEPEMASRPVSLRPNDAASKEVREAELFNVMKEILSTEETYMTNLSSCINKFLVPMRNSLVKSSKQVKLDITENQIKVLFSNMEQIASLGEILLKELRALIPKYGFISMDEMLNSLSIIFNNLTPIFKMYAMYARDQPPASQFLGEVCSEKSKHSNLREFLVDAEYSVGNTLSSFLIMPIQRIPRYKLLLEDIVRKMEKLDTRSDMWYESKMLFQKAIELLHETSDQVNNAIKSRQEGDVLVGLQNEFGSFINIIQPGRVFLRRNKFHLVKNWRPTNDKERDSEKCEFLLFNDLLLCVKKRGLFNQDKEVITYPFEPDFQVVKVIDKLNSGFLLQFGLPTNLDVVQFGHPPIILQFEDSTVYESWYRDLFESLESRTRTRTEVLHSVSNEQHSTVLPEYYVANRMMGYMLRFKVGKSWDFRRRFCILVDNSLVYYNSEEEYLNNEEANGAMSFKQTFLYLVAKSTYEDHPYVFHIYSYATGVTYAFACQSPSIMRQWINFIKATSAKSTESRNAPAPARRESISYSQKLLSGAHHAVRKLEEKGSFEFSRNDSKSMERGYSGRFEEESFSNPLSYRR